LGIGGEKKRNKMAVIILAGKRREHEEEKLKLAFKDDRPMKCPSSL